MKIDYGVLGDAVVLAQRLQSCAPPGQTYVGDSTWQLTPADFSYEPLAPVKVRGRTDPVTAWLLTGKALGGGGGGPRADDQLRPLVGRRSELSTAAEALGTGGVLIVSGEAGIGKSRFVAALAEQAAARGIRWLSSRCPAHGSFQPYSGYRELAGQLPAADDSLLRVLRGEEPADLPSQPELARVALHEAVLDPLRRAAAAGPAVLLLEDLHWMDPSSISLTASVAALTRQLPLLLVVTSRETGTALESVLESALGPAPASLRRELALAPLSPSDLADLVRDELGAPAEPSFLQLLAERTGGNALFALEVVREMRESNALDTERGSVGVRAGVRAEDVPNSLQGILAARLDLLTTSAATVIKLCAVIGRRIPHDLLQHLLGDPAAAPDANWSAALGEVQARGLLAVDDAQALTFTHALVQDVAYSRLLQRQRRELHGRVADAMEALRREGDQTDETIDLLADHLTRAGAGKRALDAIERAADRARRLYANDEARRLLRRACRLADELSGDEEPPTPEETARLRLALAGLEDLLGDYDEAESLYQRVRADTGELEAWRGEAAVLRKRGRCDEVLALLDQADLALTLSSAERGLLGLDRGPALVAAGRFGEAAQALMYALSMLPGYGADRALGLVQLARAQLGPGEVDAARRSAEEARRLFEQLGDVRGQATALRILGNVYQELHRDDDAAAALTEGLEAAGRLGDVERGACLVNLGLLELSRDRYEEATRWNQEAILEFERVGHRRGAAIAHANLADTLGRRGDLDGALQHCELAVDAARSVQDDLTVADVQATRASILLAQGRPALAAVHAGEAAEQFLAVSDLTAASEALDLASRCWQAAGNPDRAAELRARSRDLLAEGAALAQLG